MRTIRTPKKREIVLDAISHGLTVAEAANAAGISRRAIFDWRADDPEFARDYEAAYDSGTDCYAAEARRRAFTESDTLLIFLLKSRDPQRFARKLIAVGGDAGMPPIGVAHSEAGNIHFYMPPNYRDGPEEETPDEQQPAGITIEGEAATGEGDEDDAAA